MHTMWWEKVCFVILTNYKSKLSQFKLPLFHVVSGCMSSIFYKHIFMFTKQNKDNSKSI